MTNPTHPIRLANTQPPTHDEQLLNVVRVLANSQRLKLIGLLIDREYTSSELTQQLGWQEAQTLEQLAALRSLDLVSLATVNGKSSYRFNHKGLHAINKQVLSRPVLPSPIDEHPNEAERKALKSFFYGERVTIPANQKTFGMLLNWLITRFEVGVKYTEKEVNEIIKRHNEDYATLRRGMIDANLMQRENGIYWRPHP